MKIGILGSGQLATLLEEALPGLLEKAKLSGKITTELLFFPLNPQALKKCDIITFESENVDLKDLNPFSKKVIPALTCMQLLQDKLEQKNLLKKLGLPTAPFLEITNGSIAKASEALGTKFVLKWARMGYDGHGVLVVTPKTDVSQIQKFLSLANRNGSRVFAEAFAPFSRELATVITRGKTGEIAKYPIVISIQENSICSEIYGPATAFGLPKKLEIQAHEFAEKIANELNYIGTLAIELFELQSGEIWINEIAPRVHNSGHYSIEATDCSQFENHLRAVSNSLPVSQPNLTCHAFLMVNILGPNSVKNSLESAFPPDETEGATLHWYDKKEVRPWRKMGHYTALLNAPLNIVEDLKETRDRLRACIQSWHQLI